MTVDVPATARLADGESRSAGLSGIVRRAWLMPLVGHAAVLAAMLVGLAFVAGVHSTFTADEANIVLQAQTIEHGHWAFADPFPAVDHGSLASPVLNSTLSPQGLVPIAKHLFYALMVAELLRVGGAGGAMGLSIAGAVAAALAAAWLARLYAPGNERTAFWVTGAASPLFLYGVVDTGQAVGAAGGAVSAALLLTYWRKGGAWALVGSATCMGVAVIAREEAVVWCAATVVAAAAMAVRRTVGPSVMRRLLLGAVVVAGAAGTLRVAEMVISHQIFRGVPAVGASTTTGVWVHSASGLNRLGGVATALLGSGPVGDAFSLSALPVFLASFGALVLLTATAVAIRRGERIAGPATAALATLLIAARLLHGPAVTVSGFFTAFPLAWLALWAVRRHDADDPAIRWLVLTSAVYALGVAVSIYPDGGGLQWGGRYFLMALPVLAPLGVKAVRRLIGGLAGPGRTVLAGCLVAIGVAGTWQMAAAVVANHRTSGELTSVVRMAGTLAPPGDSGAPVALSASYPLGSLWPLYEDFRLLYPTGAQLGNVARRMRTAGIQKAVMVTTDPAFDNIDVSASYRVERTVPVPSDLRGCTVEILARR